MYRYLAFRIQVLTSKYICSKFANLKQDFKRYLIHYVMNELSASRIYRYSAFRIQVLRSKYIFSKQGEASKCSKVYKARIQKLLLSETHSVFSKGQKTKASFAYPIERDFLWKVEWQLFCQIIMKWDNI